MTELFYWKEMEHAILDQLCLDRNGAERLIRSRMPHGRAAPYRRPRGQSRPPSVG